MRNISNVMLENFLLVAIQHCSEILVDKPGNTILANPEGLSFIIVWEILQKIFLATAQQENNFSCHCTPAFNNFLIKEFPWNFLFPDPYLSFQL